MAINTFRDTQIAQAGNNPSIVSPLSGAPSSASSTSITPPPSQNAADIHGYPEAMKTAQDLSSKLYGSGFVSGGEGAKDSMLQQLFSYDKQLEQGYSPYPQVPGYVENPADLYSAGASYAGGLGQVMGAVEGGIGNTEKAYQTAVGGVLDKLVSLLTIQENRKAKEEDRKLKEEENAYQKSKDERDFLLTLAKLNGGSFTDPMTGKTVSVPQDGPGGGTAGERELAGLKSQLQTDIANKMTPKDLFSKYGGRLDFDTIMNVYNNPSGGSPWGPAKENWQELRQSYETSGGALKDASVNETVNNSGKDLVAQIELLPSVGERNNARATKDVYDTVLNALGKIEGVPTGPVSRSSSMIQSLAGKVTPTAQLDQELSELLRVIRKQSTGVAYSPQEITDLLKEIPNTFQQEALVKDKLNRLKSRTEQKLINYGLVPPGSAVATVRLRNPSTGQTFEYDGMNDPDYFNDINQGFERM